MSCCFQKKDTVYRKHIYLMGAGFTKSVFTEAPLNDELLSVLIKQMKATILFRYIEKYNGKFDNAKQLSIEKLLTYMDLEFIDEDIHYQNENLKPSQYIKDRININSDMVKLFRQYRFSKHAIYKNEWLIDFCNLVLKEYSIIVSLNYECFLEGLLDYLGLWDPISDYECVCFHPSAESLPANNKHIKLYKVHGSENFYISSNYPNKSMKSIGTIFNEEIFPRSARYSNYGPGSIDPKEYIVAPSFIKNFHVQLIDMMIKASNAAQSADTLIVIGCSLRKEDYFIKLFLTSFLNTFLKQKKRIIIVDPSANKIKDSLSLFWGQDLNATFDVSLLDVCFQDSIPDLLEIL